MTSSKSRRADQALVERGLVPSRARAQAEIAAGHVFLEGKKVLKAHSPIPSNALLEMRGLVSPWVSRAGLKLDHALEHFALSPEGAVVLDLGASTGGFTEVALARGASHIIAVDVGHGQMHPRLLHDPRITLYEGLNAKDISITHIPQDLAMIVSDVSFISLKKALPKALALAPVGCSLVALIKPQFEVGKENLGKGGVVRDEGLHKHICTEIIDWLQQDQGWHVKGITESPIEGGDGNKEFLIAAEKI